MAPRIPKIFVPITPPRNLLAAQVEKKNQHDKAAITFGKSYPQVCCSVFKSNVASLSVPQPRSQGHSSYERAWERGCQYLWYMYSLAAGKMGCFPNSPICM